MDMRLTRLIIISASVFWLALGLSAGEVQRGPDVVAPGPRPYPERLGGWAEGRFGLFIHWGPVSLKETEISWSRANSNPKCPNKGKIPVEVYDNLYRQFNPTNFSGMEWARIAKAAGTK